MRIGQVLSGLAVLCIAGVANAAIINLANQGNPVGNEGADTSLTRYYFTASADSGENNINTILLNVSASSALIHQVWAFGGNVPTPTNTGFLSATALGFDSYIPDGPQYSVIVTAPTENRTVTPGSTDSAVAADSGYGTSLVMEAAAPGAGLASTNWLQLVIPSTYTQVASAGDIVVDVEIVQIGGQQTFATYHFATGGGGDGGDDVIPEPSSLALLGLGGLLLARRRR